MLLRVHHMFYKVSVPLTSKSLRNIEFFEIFELTFQKSFKNIEIFEIFEFFKVFARGEAWKVREGGGDREVSLEKLKNLKNLDVFKAFLKSQLKNLKKLNVL